MRKIILVSALLTIALAGCQLIPADTGISFPKSDFDISERCPHVCWLGINPGKTTIDQAKSIINSSDQIDQSSTEFFNDYIYTNWIWGGMKDEPGLVYLHFENGVITTISIGLLPYKMKDFISLLREPDDILAWDLLRADGYEIGYQVYFRTKNVVIQVMAGGENGKWNGPDPNDYVKGIWLNAELDEDIVPDGLGMIRPWQGYGHARDYLPGGIMYPPTDLPSTPLPWPTWTSTPKIQASPSRTKAPTWTPFH